MNKRFLILVATSSLLLIASSACSTPPPGNEETAGVVTAYPTYTSYPTYTPYPTYTSYPTTIPIIATNTASAQPTNSQSDVANTILSAFQAEGIPITDIVVETAETDSNNLLGRPYQYIAKVNWKDSRIDATGDPGVDTGGTIEVFENADDMQTRKEYIETIVKSSSLFVQYIYAKGVVLLRLSHELTPDQAGVYESVFMSLP